MDRLILLEIVVFIAAFAVSYLLRKLLGRSIRGIGVIGWGVLFGLIGALAGSYAVESLLEGTRFLWTDGNLWGALAIAFRFFALTAIVGGVIGSLIASLPRGKGRNAPPPPTK